MVSSAGDFGLNKLINKFKSLSKPQINIIQNILIIIAVYLIIVHGLVTLIFASPLQTRTFTLKDEGKFIEIEGNVRYLQQSKVPIFGNNILLIRNRSSFYIIEYRGTLGRPVYDSVSTLDKAIKVKGLVKKSKTNFKSPFSDYLGKDKIYLKGHFINNRPNTLFKYSVIYILVFGIVYFWRARRNA